MDTPELNHQSLDPVQAPGNMITSPGSPVEMMTMLSNARSDVEMMTMLSNARSDEERRVLRADFQQYAKEHREKIEALFANAPEEVTVITIESDCPFEGGFISCDRCERHDGLIRERFTEPTPHIKVTDARQCLEMIRYWKHVSQCGLVIDEYYHTFANAKLDVHNRKVMKILQAWDHTAGRGLYLVGPNGTGKTYALHALALKLCRAGVKCFFTSTYQLLSNLSECMRGQRDESVIMGQCISPAVLLLDDIGKEHIRSDWAPERFFRVIDDRARYGRPIVISSNLQPEQLEAHFGENFGPAIVSRIMGSCDLWDVVGPDRRLAKK